MRPKKELIERSLRNGSFAQANKLLSTAHILMCVANGFSEEGHELFLKNGLVLGELKKKFNLFVKAADSYFEEFAKMVTTEKMTMFGDMEEVEGIIREWAKIDKDWKPKED